MNFGRISLISICILFCLLVRFECSLLSNVWPTKFFIENNDLNENVFNQREIDRDELNKNIQAKNIFTSRVHYGKTSLETRQFEFNNISNRMIFQFGHDSTTWLLTHNENNMASNQVYVSLDGSQSYINYNQYEEYCLERKIEISNIYINPMDRKRIIFTDIINKALFISINNGQDLMKVDISFRPELIYFTRNADTLIGFDSTNKQLWISFNFGNQWEQIGNNIANFLEWNDLRNVLLDNLYFSEENLNQLIKFDIKNYLTNFDVTKNKIYMKQNFQDFETSNNFYLLTKVSEKNNKDFLISNNGNDWFPVNIKNVDGKIQKISLAIATEVEIFIVVTHESENQIKTDLFRSDAKNFQSFEISLRDIINNCQTIDLKKTLNKNSFLDEPVKNCIEMRALSKYSNGNSYLANAKDDNQKTKTFMKLKKSQWTQIEYHEYDKSFDNDSGKYWSLDLNENFIQLYNQAQNSFADSNFPDLMIAPVKKNNSKIGIFLTIKEENQWYEILKENYLFGITSSAEIRMKILVAVEKNKLTNKLMYSFNNGDRWMDYYFSNSSVVVNELIVDQRTNSAAFYLVSKKLNNQNVIFIVDFKADNKARPSFTILNTIPNKIC